MFTFLQNWFRAQKTIADLEREKKKVEAELARVLKSVENAVDIRKQLEAACASRDGYKELYQVASEAMKQWEPLIARGLQDIVPAAVGRAYGKNPTPYGKIVNCDMPNGPVLWRFSFPAREILLREEDFVNGFPD